MQANDAEGRKNDRLRKEKKGKNLTKVDRYLQGKRGVLTTSKFRLVAGNTIRAEARYNMPQKTYLYSYLCPIGQLYTHPEGHLINFFLL